MKIQKWLMPAVLLLMWIGASAASLTNPLLIPTPWQVMSLMLKPSIWVSVGGDVATTSLRLFVGFILGGFVGVCAGVAMGRSSRVYDALEFLVDFFRSIPVAALFPLFVVFFGIGDLSKIVTTSWSTALVVLVHTMYGVRTCSHVRERFARTIGATQLQVLATIVLPEASPSILAGLRTGLGIAMIVVVMTEMFLGTTSGLGSRIFNAALLYKTPELYFTIGITGILGYTLNQLFVKLETHLLRWKYTQ